MCATSVPPSERCPVLSPERNGLGWGRRLTSAHTMTRPRRFATLALAVGALLALPIPTAAAYPMALSEGPAANPGDLLPDIKMAPIYDVSLKFTSAGKVRLRFGSTIWNIGQGPLEARGT